MTSHELATVFVQMSPAGADAAPAPRRAPRGKEQSGTSSQQPPGKRAPRLLMIRKERIPSDNQVSSEETPALADPSMQLEAPRQRQPMDLDPRPGTGGVKVSALTRQVCGRSSPAIESGHRFGNP